MRRAIISCALLGTWMFFAAESVAQITFSQNQSQSVAPVAYNDSYSRPAVEASPSDWSTSYVSARLDDQSCVQTSCCCNEATCGCESGCCDCGNDCGLLDDCCLGNAWTLHDELHPCSDHNYGGWIQMGYHNDNNRLSNAPNDLGAFNDRPDEVNLHQAWVYFEKLAEAGCCSSDWGYRVDVMYGTDAQKIQSFGNPGGTWDVTFDNGAYGWAIPQAYVELAQGDWSLKIGRFFTPMGYEVATAPGNFFYSHAMTMYNSEAFGHTGVLASYEVNCDTTLHVGWTLGWDTGFDQFGGGSNFLGGVSTALSDNIDFTYILTSGDLGWRSANFNGYSHSMVFDVAVSNRLNYVLQSDYVEHDGSFGNAAVPLEHVGINQYMIYTINDCWGVGGRMEWWKATGIAGTSPTSFYAITGGVNYKPHANVVIRPEVRYNWTPSNNAYAAAQGGIDYNQTVFGIDAIFTF